MGMVLVFFVVFFLLALRRKGESRCKVSSDPGSAPEPAGWHQPLRTHHSVCLWICPDDTFLAPFLLPPLDPLIRTQICPRTHPWIQPQNCCVFHATLENSAIFAQFVLKPNDEDVSEGAFARNVLQNQERGII